MQGFNPGAPPKDFSLTQPAVDNTFSTQPHLISRPFLRRFRSEARDVWVAATDAA
jgi:putative transposase